MIGPASDKFLCSVMEQSILGVQWWLKLKLWLSISMVIHGDKNSKTTIDLIKNIHYCLKCSLKWPILGTFSFWNKAPNKQLPPPWCGHCRMLTFFFWEEFGQHIDWIKIPSKMEVAPRYKLLYTLNTAFSVFTAFTTYAACTAYSSLYEHTILLWVLRSSGAEK